MGMRLSAERAPQTQAAGGTSLSVQDITVRYGEVQAVRGLSLSVPEGGCIGVTGANGAGKSTLLRAIMGLVPLSAGGIEFRGERLVGLRPEERARRGLSLVPEGRGTLPSLTVEENLLIGGYTRRGSLKQDLERAYELLPQLRRLSQRPARFLSGGELQLLGIGRALMARPKLMMLDEPSMGLAPAAIETVLIALAALRKSGISMLLVEQNVHLVLELADYTYGLEVGHIVFQGPPADMPLPASIQVRSARRREV